MFASGALDKAHLQYGFMLAPIRRKWIYWNLVQTIVSKAAGGLVSANSISLQNGRRSFQKSFSHFFLLSTKIFKSRLNLVSLDLSTTFCFHIFLGKNPTTKYGDDCFICSTCHSLCLMCAFTVQQLQSACLHYRQDKCPGHTIYNFSSGGIQSNMGHLIGFHLLRWQDWLAEKCINKQKQFL